MFFVGFISCPPTTGFFIPATAEVTAMAIIASTTANFLFIIFVLSELGFSTLTNSTEEIRFWIFREPAVWLSSRSCFRNVKSLDWPARAVRQVALSGLG